MTAQQIREKYLSFFRSKNHTIIPPASLIPSETDPTVLFTTAGMHPLVPYLLGEKHPGGNRVVNVQKCIRTGDIDEVGDASHLTFFEMMGNWSFGDPNAADGVGAGYFKKEAIEWSWEFLTSEKWLGLNPDFLAVSVFKGDKDAPQDDESAEIWLKVSKNKLEGRIDYLPKEKNWWGPAGQTGPCGPDTEIFYWTGNSAPPKKIASGDLADNSHWLEIWNNVFMQYNKTADGCFEALSQKNVDTGMGLERVLTILNNKESVFETELFQPIFEKIKSIIPIVAKGSEEQEKSFRIIADHIKAATFIIADGIAPSNTQRGYVLRRLIRRAIRYGKLIGITKNFITDIADVIVKIYVDSYPELEKNKDRIFKELEEEEKKFKKTLDAGTKKLEEIANVRKGLEGRISGKEAFDLYQTYGFPLELTIELAQENRLSVDVEKYSKELQKHQELSRTASAGLFKGGLADMNETTKKLHTATHLLHAALRKVLGNHVLQKGSNITSERLRFDFSHPKKMTPEEIKEVEDLVNKKIQENLPIICEEMTIKEAEQKNALGVFEEKYGEKVKVYSVADPLAGSGQTFSKEICGGPHVNNTGELGEFKILKEEASSAGIRRIKAIIIEV